MKNVERAIALFCQGQNNKGINEFRLEEVIGLND